MRFSSLALLRTLVSKRPGWRRHLPAATALFALATLVVGPAHPARSEEVPREDAVVVLVSTSRAR